MGAVIPHEKSGPNANLDYAETDTGSYNNNSVTFDAAGHITNTANTMINASTNMLNVSNTLHCFNAKLEDNENQAMHNYMCIQENIIIPSNLGQQFACDATQKISNILTCDYSPSRSDQTRQVNAVLGSYLYSNDTVSGSGDDVSVDICDPNSIMNLDNKCHH